MQAATRSAEPLTVPPLHSIAPPPYPVELTELLAALEPGARERAWGAFLERYSRLLLSVAFTFGPDYDRAMDRYAYMVEELQRQGHRRLRAYRPAGSARFTTWLTAVSRRLCIDHHRRCFGRTSRSTRSDSHWTRCWLQSPSGDSTDIHSLPDPRVMDPGDALVHAECDDAVRRAILRLPASDARLLELWFQDQLPARHIAQILAFPTPFHVYRRVRAVCGTLRAELAQTGVGRDRPGALR
jgi:RNA polymerase sigma factor (sigma-70 family)